MPILSVGPASGPPPLTVDAVVLEEDRWLVLSAPPEVPESREHPLRLFTALVEAEPASLGDVVVRPGRPTRLLAVVHDLDREPSCTLADVRAALEAVVRVCHERGLHRLALPLLGTAHARLDRDAVLREIAEVLARATHVQAVWLQTEDTEALDLLRAAWP